MSLGNGFYSAYYSDGEQDIRQDIALFRMLIRQTPPWRWKRRRSLTRILNDLLDLCPTSDTSRKENHA